MKKYLKLTFVLALIFSICGCTTKDLMKQTEEISDVIINLYQDIYYDYSFLPDDSIKIVNKLKEYEESSEKSINLTKNMLLNPESYTTEKDSEGVYVKNDDYHVYYNKLKFNNTDEDGRKYAIVNANNEVAVIYKDEWPILYKDTKNNVNYRYRYMDSVRENNEIKYYYRSYGNSSSLTITYLLNNEKINDVELEYNNYYDHVVEKTTNKSSNNSAILIVAGIGIGLGLIVFIFLKAKRAQNI